MKKNAVKKRRHWGTDEANRDEGRLEGDPADSGREGGDGRCAAVRAAGLSCESQRA